MLNVCLSGANRIGELDHWSFVLSHFPADKVYILGGPSTLDTNAKNLVDAVRVPTAEDLPTDVPLILFSPKAARYVPGTVPLTEFVHPENATYMFGPNTLHLSEDELGSRLPDTSVYIPTPNHHEFYDFVAASVVFWDRMRSHG